MQTDIMMTFTYPSFMKIDQYVNKENALYLYFFYYKTAKYQHTNRPWATISFCAQGLDWGENRVREAKKTLIDAGLIKEIHASGKEGKAYIQILFASSGDMFCEIEEAKENLCTTQNQEGKENTENLCTHGFVGGNKTDRQMLSTRKENAYDKKVKSFSKEKEPYGLGEVNFNGLVCKICGEKQFKTRSGDSCKNGHRGAEGVNLKEHKKPILHNLSRIGSAPLKKIQPSGLTLFNYSTEAKQILKCWQDYNGRLHINGNAKTAGLIQRMIDELLIEGRNPYISLTDDLNLRFKKWTVKEICDCIIFYAGVDGLNKDIEDMYFHSFIVRRFNGFNGRNRKDHSPLIDSFKDEPKNSEWAKIIKKRFTSEFPKATVYSKSVQTIANFLEDKSDDYIITDPGNNSFLPTMFFRYMKQQVEVAGKYDPIKYMASQSNQDDFFSGLVKGFRAKKRTKEEKKKWLIDKPIMAENRRKASEPRDNQLKRKSAI